MSSSESESSEISAEPTGAITGRREVTRIMQMDPFYEVPEGKLVDVSEPDQRVPDVGWGTSDAWSTSRRTATEEMHEAFATVRASEKELDDTTTAMLEAQKESTSKLADMTFSMASILEELVGDVMTVKKTLDSGYFPSPTPQETSSAARSNEPNYERTGARPKLLSVSGPKQSSSPNRHHKDDIPRAQTGVTSHPNSSMEVNVGSPKQGQGYIYDYSSSEDEDLRRANNSTRRSSREGARPDTRQKDTPRYNQGDRREVEEPCPDWQYRPETPAPGRRPNQYHHSWPATQDD